MENSKSVLWASGAVIVCIAGAFIGYNARSHSEMGFASPGLNSSTLIASNDPAAANTITESQYFYEVTQLLKQQYVDPINDDQTQRMASGAVRGIVNSLLDPDSIFLNKEQFEAYRRNQAGTFEGIGAEIRYVFNEEEVQKVRDGETNADALMLLPEVAVQTVIPGGPADEAGLKPGDFITSVNGKSIVTFKDIKTVRDLQTAVTDGKATKEDLEKVRQNLEAKIKNNLATNKAREHLVVGKSGTVQVGWVSNGRSNKQTIAKAVTKISPVETTPEGHIAVRFIDGVGKALKGLSLQNGATLDLRNGPSGNTDALMDALEALAPAGTYGVITKLQGQSSIKVTTKSGPSNPVRLNLEVDSTTTGVAAIFAKALEAKGLATIHGTLPDAPLKWVIDEELPDGTGYTLLTGIFQTDPDAKTEIASK